MVPDADTADLFARLADELTAAPDEEQTLERTVALAVAVVPGCDAAGVTVRRDGRLTTPASTGPIVAQADELQYELNEGPCVDAIRAPEDFYNSPDLANESRWPRWGPRVAELGFHSIVSVRIPTSAVEASINLYGAQLRAFDDDAEQLALVYSRQAATALNAQHRVKDLQTALSTRHAIGVAQGVLMERYHLSVEQSFNLLVRVSQHQNIKLRDLAAAVVQSGAGALAVPNAGQRPVPDVEKGA